MRIGILTYHCVPNFGAQLQTISTIGFLKRYGFDPIVINWYPEDLEVMYRNRIPMEQIKMHNEITKNIMPTTTIIRTEKCLIKSIDELKLSGLIVGSDALFKYLPQKLRYHYSLKKFKRIYTQPMSCIDLVGNPFWGGFIKKLSHPIPVCAFSVSSQNCSYKLMNPEEILKMQEFLSSFSYISVRDLWTANMVKFVTGKNVMITPDPVFSFNENNKLELPSKEDILKKYSLPENYVLLSFSSWYIKTNYLNELAKEVNFRGYTAVFLPMPEGLFDSKNGISINIPLSPIDWYCLIKYAKGYIGERMHPIVCCIHNVVPFICFDEYGILEFRFRGLLKKHYIDTSKTYLILKEAKLEKQMYAYNQEKELPSAIEVINNLLSFDILRCKQFAEQYQTYYENSMLNVIKFFK